MARGCGPSKGGDALARIDGWRRGELGIGVKGVGAGNDENVSLKLKFFTCSVGVGEVKGHTVATREANAGALRTIVSI